MLKVARYALLTLALYALIAASPAWAWSLTNMFSSGSTPTSNIKSAKKVGSKGRSASKPGMVDSLTSAPKKLYTNTKAMVTPSKKPTPPPARQRSDAWKGYTPSPSSAQKPSGIKSLFKPEPVPQPRTVGEWMKQDRVQP